MQDSSGCLETREESHWIANDGTIANPDLSVLAHTAAGDDEQLLNSYQRTRLHCLPRLPRCFRQVCSGWCKIRCLTQLIGWNFSPTLARTDRPDLLSLRRYSANCSVPGRRSKWKVIYFVRICSCPPVYSIYWIKNQSPYLRLKSKRAVKLNKL